MLTLLLFAIQATTQLATQTGDIQVTSAPGIKVFLDGSAVGATTADEDGLFISSVPAGSHSVRVEKAGFQPQEYTVRVEPRRTTEVKIAEFVPGIVVKQQGDSSDTNVRQRVGTLILTTAPMKASVEFQGRTEEKTKPEIVFSGIPIGTYTVKVRKAERALNGTVTIEEGTTVRAKADLLNNQFQILAVEGASTQNAAPPTNSAPNPFDFFFADRRKPEAAPRSTSEPAYKQVKSLGIVICDITPRIRDTYAIDDNLRGGVVVTSVEPRSAAADALFPGDVITEINGTSIVAVTAAIDLLQNIRSGANIRLYVITPSRAGSVQGFKYIKAP